jgi:hypothetical protein
MDIASSTGKIGTASRPVPVSGKHHLCMEYARYWSSGRLARFPFYLPACLMAQWVHPIRIPSFLASRSLRFQPVCCNKPKLQYHVNPSRQKELNPQTCWVAYLDQGTDLLGTELSLSSRGRMTLGVGEIFWFISHTLPQCHALQGVGDTYL